jgi:hypothetical protein
MCTSYKTKSSVLHNYVRKMIKYSICFADEHNGKWNGNSDNLITKIIEQGDDHGILHLQLLGLQTTFTDLW